MIKNIGIEEYLSQYTKETFKELSREKNGAREPLVDSTGLGYNFDDISKNLFMSEKLKSADAIVIKEKTICVIEFKKGYKKRINSTNFDKSKWICPSTKAYCEDGAGYFLKYQQLTTKEMNLSIRMKAIESFITLEKFIFPYCSTTNSDYKIKFLAVIDAVNDIPLDIYEYQLCELGNSAGKSTENAVESLKKGLSKYIKKDRDGVDLLYDSVDVYTKEQFDLKFT